MVGFGPLSLKMAENIAMDKRTKEAKVEEKFYKRKPEISFLESIQDTSFRERW